MRAVAAAALAAVALTGCAGEKDDRRDAVDDYVETVNATQREALIPWNSARMAYAAVGRRELSDRQLRVLGTAPATIRELRTRIAAVAPPADARRLRERLLRLLDLQASVAAEVSAFARYVTAVSPLEQRLADETAKLRRTLQRSRAQAPERQALSRYAAELAALRRQLERLDPPKALEPWHAGQLARVETLRAGAGAAATGLAKKDAALIGSGVAALTSGAAGVPVTEAERAAIVAYNERLSRIRTASAAVTSEQARLVRELA